MAEPTIKLGGGNWAGKSDNLLGYYKEGERFYKQDFTFSRSTTGTYTDSDGYIQEMPYNEVTYSEQFDLWAISGSITRTSNIATAPNGTLTADGIQDTSGGSYKRVRKSISVNPNSTYTSSCYIKKVTSETAYTGFGLVFSGGTQKLAYGIIDSVNGTITSASSTITPTFNVVSVGDYWRFEMTATDNGSNSSLEFSIYATLSTNGTSLNVGIGSIRTLWGAQINKGTSAKTYFPTTTRLNMPRVDYLNNSNGSLILEPQRTNILTYSNFQNHWSLDDTTIVANNTTSPDGTVNGNLLKGNTNSSRHNIYKSFSPQSTDSVLSVFAKAKELRYIQIASANTVHQYVNFDVSSGVVGNVGSGFSNAKIENYGNGWYRCSVTATNQSNAFYFGLISGLTSSWLESWTMSNDTDGLYIWGAMAESNASYPTSYIPTSGSSVTRNADSCSITDVADRIGQTEGVIFIDFELQTTGEDFVIMNLYNTSSASNGIYFYLDGSNLLKAYCDNSGNQVLISSGVLSEGRFKAAFAYKENDFAFYLNGSLIGVDNSGTVPTCGALRLENYQNSPTYQEKTKVYQAQIYNTRLSNSELATLTTL